VCPLQLDSSEVEENVGKMEKNKSEGIVAILEGQLWMAQN